MEHLLLALGGATGSGKTALAIQLTKKHSNLVIVSADSRQIYKRLDVGTAKIGTPATDSSLTGKPEPVWTIDGIPQFLIDIAEPNTTFTLAEYQKEAYRLIHACWTHGKIPFLVGGTGLYLQAITEGYVLEGAQSNERRAELEQLAVSSLQHIASEKNISLNDSDWKNKHRLVRAIERSESGITQAQTNPITHNVKTFVLEREWETQRDLAPDMVQERLDLGLIEETKQLLDSSIDKQRLKDTGLSYRLVIRMFDGEFPESELKTTLIHAFRQLMRRQRTWFNRMPHAQKGSNDFIAQEIGALLTH